MRIILQTLIFALYCTSTFGNTVTSIQIEGNKHTKDEIILREIHHSIPSEFNKEIAKEDRNRIYNLGLFSTVEITEVNSVYKIKVAESLRWMPFPMFDYNEAKGKNGWSYGGGLAFLNFRGLNEKLYLGGTIGETKSYFFNFEDPWMWGDHGSVNFGISDNTFDDAVYAYEFHQKSFSIGTGYYIGLHHQFEYKLGFDHIKIDEMADTLYQQLPESSILEQQHISAFFEYVYDSRDIYTDPTKGWLITSNLSSNIGVDSSYSYYNIDFDFTKYIEISQLPFEPVLSINTSIFMQFSEHLPIFCKTYLGGEDYVRGYSSIPSDNPMEAVDKIEVENLIFHSLEYQHTLIPKKDFGGVEMGIDFVLFTDFGYGADNLQKLKPSNGLLGFGYGFTFFMSSMGVLGFDFGFNPYENGYLMHLSMSN